MRRRRGEGVALTLLLISGLLAAAPAGGQERFEDEALVVAVEVPVQVIRDGAPLRGLGPEDFEVYASGKRQELLDFEVIDLRVEAGAVADLTLPVTARRRRHFLLLFDLSFSEPDSVERARQAARNLMSTSLHPSDLVAVATYSASRGARLVLGFTPDRRQVDVAIETLGLAEPLRHRRDPLGLTISDFDPSGSPLRGGGGFQDSKSERHQIMVENFRDMEAMTQRTTREVQQTQVLAMAGALEELARLMNSVKGRKLVIFLSEGFDSSVMVGTEDAERMQQIAEEASRGEFWRVDSDERFGSYSVQRGVMGMLEEFRRADCTIQSVDIGGVRAGADIAPRASGEDGLFILADQTGGEFYRNYNNLGSAIGTVLERSSVTYLLTFQPSDIKADGRYHRLRVRLADRSKGVRLAHRPGFYAPRPFAERSGTERQLDAAGLVMGGAEGGRLQLSILAAPFEGSDDRAYVPVLIELDGPSLLADRPLPGGQLPAEIYAYAIDSGGSVRDFFSSALRFDLEKVGEVFRGSGFKLWGHFDLPPGDYVVRVLARNAGTGSFGVRMAELSVPRFEASRPLLLPPLFPEPVGKWLLSREPEERWTDAPYPFMIAERPFVPAARPVLRAGEPAELSLIGYGLGDGQLAIEGRLLDPEGLVVEGSELRVEGRDGGAVGGPARWIASFRPGAAEPGEYLLEVTVRNPASGHTEASTISVLLEG